MPRDQTDRQRHLDYSVLGRIQRLISSNLQIKSEQISRFEQSIPVEDGGGVRAMAEPPASPPPRPPHHHHHHHQLVISSDFDAVVGERAWYLP
jgi:hypothetical protein